MNIFYSTLLTILFSSSLIGQNFKLGDFTGKAISLPVVADFDGDDKPDIVGVSRFFSAVGDLKLHVNISEPDSIIFETLDLGISVYGNPGIGDFDNDNDMDIVVIESDNSQILILLNNGDGTFETKTLESEVAYSFRTSDLDGDGDVDIVSLNIDDGSAFIMINDGNGNFETVDLLINVEDLYTIELEDFDGDNDIDIIAGFDDFFSAKIILLENKGALVFDEKIITENGSGSLQQLQIIDIDNDGLKDVIYASDRVSILKALINNGNNTYEKKDLAQGQGDVISFSVADYNSDGIFDIIIGSDFDDNTYHQGLSSTSLQYDTEVISGIQPLFYIVNGDFDSDDDLDLILSNGDFWWMTNQLVQGPVNTTEVKEAEYQIYPNPFVSHVILDPGGNDMGIFITDLLGKRVFESKENDLPFNLNSLNKGCYMLSIFDIYSGKIVQTSKIFKIE